MLYFLAALALLGAVSSLVMGGAFVLVVSTILAATAAVGFLVNGEGAILLRLVLGLAAFQVSYILAGLVGSFWRNRQAMDKAATRDRRVSDESRRRNYRRKPWRLLRR